MVLIIKSVLPVLLHLEIACKVQSSHFRPEELPVIFSHRFHHGAKNYGFWRLHNNQNHKTDFYRKESDLLDIGTQQCAHYHFYGVLRLSNSCTPNIKPNLHIFTPMSQWLTFVQHLTFW